MEPDEIAPPLAGAVIGEGDFVIAEWQDPGRPPGPPFLIAPPHIHHKDDEAWYVLQGALCVQVGDKVVEAKAGAAVFVPRGARHTYWNPLETQTRYLLVMTPKIHRMIQEIHTTSDRSPEAMRSLFAKYDSELV